MNVDDFAESVFLNACIWGLAYKISLEAEHDAYLGVGVVMSILYTLLNKYRKNRYQRALKLIRNEALQEELTHLAREASAAINTAAEIHRKHRLGYASDAVLDQVETQREEATVRFNQLQRAALAIGNPLVRATIKDYLETRP